MNNAAEKLPEMNASSPSQRSGNPPETPDASVARSRARILTISTIGFTLLFAVWLMFGILAIPIRAELHLSDVQFAWLTAIAILNGSIWRLVFGMLADRYGGRLMMTLLLLICIPPALTVAYAHTYAELMVCAFLVGMAGNGFSVGIAWNSAWYPRQRQGFALGVFGAGNVGASITKLIGPTIIAIVPAVGFEVMGLHVPGGWRFVPVIYAALLLAMAAVTFWMTPAVDRKPGKGRSFKERLRPLSHTRVWRFSLYYVIVFGAYVALCLWLPKYYKDVYHLSLSSAALLTALFIFPASLLRPLGGYLSDRFGARPVLYGVFIVVTLATLILSIPSFHMTFDGKVGDVHFQMGVGAFTAAVFVLGVGMGVGKAAVFKFIPEYFPNDIGAVGGLVGAFGGLGGFFLPPLFGYAEQATGMPQMIFGVLTLITTASFVWLHVTVLGIKRRLAAKHTDDFEPASNHVSLVV